MRAGKAHATAALVDGGRAITGTSTGSVNSGADSPWRKQGLADHVLSISTEVVKMIGNSVMPNVTDNNEQLLLNAQRRQNLINDYLRTKEEASYHGIRDWMRRCGWVRGDMLKAHRSQLNAKQKQLKEQLQTEFNVDVELISERRQ